MPTCVHWHVEYPLRLPHAEYMMQDGSVLMDQSIVHLRAMKVLSVQAASFRRRKRPVSRSWWLDDIYIKISGQWKLGGITFEFPGEVRCHIP